LSKAESDCYSQRIKRIIDSWQAAADWRAQRGKKGRIEQPNDVFLLIDVKKSAIWVEYKGNVVEELYSELPEGMKWEMYHLTPDGNEHLPDVVRLQVRGIYTDQIFAETIYLAGSGRGWHMNYQIKSHTCGSDRGTGEQIVIPKYNGKKPKGDDPYESIIVDDKEYAGYLVALKDRGEAENDETVELLFYGSESLRENLKKWQAVEKRMYAEMEHQLRQEGYETRDIKLEIGPSYLAGHAELDGRDDGFLRSRSVNVNLNYEYLGEDIWYVFSAPEPIHGIRMGRPLNHNLEFLVSSSGKIAKDEVDT